MLCKSDSLIPLFFFFLSRVIVIYTEPSCWHQTEESRRTKSCLYYPVVGDKKSIEECRTKYKTKFGIELDLYKGGSNDPFHPSSNINGNIVACYIECPKDQKNRDELKQILEDNGVDFWSVKEKKPAIHFYALQMSNGEHRNFFKNNSDKLRERMLKDINNEEKINESNATTATIYYQKFGKEPFIGGIVGEKVPSNWRGVILISQEKQKQIQERKFKDLEKDEFDVILQTAINRGEVELKPEPETSNPE